MLKIKNNMRKVLFLLGVLIFFPVVFAMGQERLKLTLSRTIELANDSSLDAFRAQNMYLAGFPAEELMHISGHKSMSAFMRYIKIDNIEAARRLKALRATLSLKK